MTVGIDLGTSTSEIAFVDDKGNVVVIPNMEKETITPSVVYIKRSGKAVVGAMAKEYLFTRPDCTFMEVKRKFGTDAKFTAHGDDYTPEEIQSHIIEYLVDCAEEYTARDVTGAVITVPAYFTDIQRKQTIRAGELAGIRVERVINEPTAAALDYGLQNMTECQHMLVYDFGGGTLDVTVLELFEGVIDVKSSCGNSQLGGKDFDEALMKHIAGAHYSKLLENPLAQMKLKQAATDCKTALSAEESTQVRLPLITDDISIDITVTRGEFEDLIRPMVESTGLQIDTALQDAGLKASDLQKVILVGGTTRVPLVRNYVEKKLGIAHETETGDNYNPELMVVRGAAIQAAIIEGIIPEERSVVLADVCPFTLGVKVLTRDALIVDPLIKRNVTIPYEYSKVYTTFHEYQRAICVEIYQGESARPQENTRIGQLNLDKLPQRRDERAKIEVTFAYDVNGLLNVTARSLGNDRTAATVIDINDSNTAARPPVKLDTWLDADGASKYRPLMKRTQKVLDEFIGTTVFLEEELFMVRELCDDLKADLIVGDKEGAEKKAEHIRGFLDNWKPPSASYVR